MSSPIPPLEAAWQTLRSSLEWAREFGLVFVFCSDALAKQALFQRANDLMQAQVRPFQRPEAHQSEALLKRLLPLAINPSSVHVDMGMPLWLDLDGHPGHSAWDQARREFLYRLNERRATLAREHSRTVVLVLPLDWTKQAAEAAPDLWTIRQPSVYLDTQESARTLALTPDSRPEPPTNSAPGTQLPAAVLRWQANQESGQAAMSVWDAAQASDAALASGHSDLAWQIAKVTAERVRALIDKSGKTPERLRDLSVSMDRLGDVIQALGRLDEAQQAYRESEKLDRALINDFGKTPERLRDLSISMNKLGDVGQSLGRLDEAQQAYRESEKLRRALIDDFGKTPERLRDLSISMERLGDVAQSLGRLDESQQAYRESEKLHRALIDDFGKTPERLRDLSVSMNKLGDVAQSLGRLDEAQQAYRESEKLHRALIDDFGKTPERLRDLSVSMERLGDVARTLGRLDEAQQAYRESEKLRRALIDDHGKTPERLRDLSVSMERLGDVARALGQLNEAQQAYAAEVELATDLIASFGEAATALEVLAYGEMNLGLTLIQQGLPDQAQTKLQHARRLYQRLVQAMPHEQKYKSALRELGVTETDASPDGNNS